MTFRLTTRTRLRCLEKKARISQRTKAIMASRMGHPIRVTKAVNLP